MKLKGRFALFLCCVAGALLIAPPVPAHFGSYMTTRYNAQWNVRDILWDDYGWFVSSVRCGSSTWTVGIHFPCTFNRLGSRYIVCYHSLDYDYGIVTSYRSWSCRKWY